MVDNKERGFVKGRSQSRTDNVIGSSGATVGAHVARDQAAASDIFLEGIKGFLREAQKKTPDPQLKGNFFERIEVAKFNRNAAAAGRAGKDIDARLTADIGRPHDPRDILIGHKPFQLKASGDVKWLAEKACDPKYEGIEVLVPSDMVGKVNRELEKMGETKRVSGELQKGGIRSGGTKNEEIQRATKNPEHYAQIETAKQIGREAIETGAYAAGAAAVLSGAMSAVKNGIAYRRGNIDGGQALANIGKDAAQSGARGGATGALGVGIRHGARHLGVPMKSNIATAVAAAAVEVGVTVYDFARGEISAEEAGERIGETGCSAAGGIYVGVAAGAIFGPPGAVVGSIVGYMAAAWIYQSCMAVLKQARLAEEEAARLEVLCAESVQEWNRRRQEFESQMTGLLEERHAAFSHCFAVIDEALEADEVDNAVGGLALLAAITGSALKFEGFEEFRDFMEQETDARLVI